MVSVELLFAAVVAAIVIYSIVRAMLNREKRDQHSVLTILERELKSSGGSVVKKLDDLPHKMNFECVIKDDLLSFNIVTAFYKENSPAQSSNWTHVNVHLLCQVPRALDGAWSEFMRNDAIRIFPLETEERRSDQFICTSNYEAGKIDRANFKQYIADVMSDLRTVLEMLKSGK